MRDYSSLDRELNLLKSNLNSLDRELNLLKLELDGVCSKALNVLGEYPKDIQNLIHQLGVICPEVYPDDDFENLKLDIKNVLELLDQLGIGCQVKDGGELLFFEKENNEKMEFISQANQKLTLARFVLYGGQIELRSSKRLIRFTFSRPRNNKEKQDHQLILCGFVHSEGSNYHTISINRSTNDNVDITFDDYYNDFNRSTIYFDPSFVRIENKKNGTSSLGDYSFPEKVVEGDFTIAEMQEIIRTHHDVKPFVNYYGTIYPELKEFLNNFMKIESTDKRQGK